VVVLVVGGRRCGEESVGWLWRRGVEVFGWEFEFWILLMEILVEIWLLE
jgi:hypothetical protein